MNSLSVKISADNLAYEPVRVLNGTAGCSVDPRWDCSFSLLHCSLRVVGQRILAYFWA